MAHDRAALLDVDGTLVDTTYLHTLAWWRAFHRNGHSPTMTQVHRLIGLGSSRLVEAIAGEARPELVEAQVGCFEELRPEATVIPGARELVRWLADQGLAVVLATSGRAEDTDHLRGLLDVEDALAAVVSASETDEAKPDPDIFRLGLEKVGVPPEQAVAVGDTVWDVRAATATGVPCIAVLTGGIGASELADAGAALVCDDPDDVRARAGDGPLATLTGARHASTPRAAT
ncbi:MAG TPA: HAD family hydrolase [Acidimicrobiales bacterium]|nr:HAD family hydrolase [Acidimicrobiales bacterium]